MLTVSAANKKVKIDKTRRDRIIRMDKGQLLTLTWRPFRNWQISGLSCGGIRFSGV